MLSQLQSAFRELLVARDGTCPVTGHRPPQCDAAHLVPASRPDVRAFVGYCLTLLAVRPTCRFGRRRLSRRRWYIVGQDYAQAV